MPDLPLNCPCGALRGVALELAPDRGNHVVCMCDDCQAYARHLGTADQVLDTHGGTEIFQTFPNRIRLTGGVEHLRCLRLSHKGLHRWYAGCCRTPVANSLGKAWIPFLGILHTFWSGADAAMRDAALGPVLYRTFGRFAVGEPPPDAHPGVPPGLAWRATRQTLAGLARRAHRPSPLFVDGRR